MYSVFVVDDDLTQRKLIEKMLRESDDILIRPLGGCESPPTNQTHERDYGWYRQFEKENKRRNY